MGTGVSAPEALVLICARNDLFAITGLVGGGGVSVVCEVCVCGASSLSSAPNQRGKATKLNTPLSSNFRGRTVGPICQVFSWTDVPRMRLQLKILFGIKALTILKKSGKTCWGGGGGGGRCHPHPHWRVKPMTCNRLYIQLNLLVSAAENCEFMIHTLSAATSISGSVQYPLTDSG